MNSPFSSPSPPSPAQSSTQSPSPSHHLALSAPSDTPRPPYGLAPYGFNIADMINYAWRARGFLICGALAGLLVAALLLIFLKPHYEAWMVVAPPREGAETLNFLVENPPPILAPMANQSIPRAGEYVRFQQTLRGPTIAKILIDKEGFLPALNQKTTFRWSSGNLSGPTQLSQALSKQIRLDPIGATDSLRLSYTHPDPQFAVKMLQSLVLTTDQLIRLDVRADVQSRIDWLKAQLKTTLNPDHRQALTKLLMAEERRRMLLSINTPYALSVIEPATALPRPVTPKPTLLVPLCLIIGLAAAFGIFTLREDWRKKRFPPLHAQLPH
ncbi:MAG: hypothetical protein JNK24_07015 [Alphaproteobacteria bacterium]|nr:hypothetical protein [Alphaproteobacteria bacterium]